MARDTPPLMAGALAIWTAIAAAWYYSHVTPGVENRTGYAVIMVFISLFMVYKAVTRDADAS